MDVSPALRRRLGGALALAALLAIAGCTSTSDEGATNRTTTTEAPSDKRSDAVENLSIIVYGPGFQPDEAGKVESFIDRTLVRCDDLRNPTEVADLVAGAGEAVRAGAPPEVYREVVEQLDIAFDGDRLTCRDRAVAVTAIMRDEF